MLALDRDTPVRIHRFGITSEVIKNLNRDGILEQDPKTILLGVLQLHEGRYDTINQEPANFSSQIQRWHGCLLGI